MKKHSIKYLASAVNPDQWPEQGPPEVVLIGRSNAGKSSLINAMWGKPVAFVSSKPGKTNVLNFYDVSGSYRVVDSPGYGFAHKRAQLEAGFKGIEIYLNARQTLKGLLVIADVKRRIEEEEEWIVEFCQKNNIPVAVVLNKSDKLNQKERSEQKKIWSSINVPIFLVSAQEKSGVPELERWIFDSWIKT